nr:PREDICTED: ATP synthase subunit s-like protein [Bemisia tabaci]
MSALLTLRPLHLLTRITSVTELIGCNIQVFKRFQHRSPRENKSQYDREMELSAKDFRYEDMPILSKLMVADEGKVPFAVRMRKLLKRKGSIFGAFEDDIREAQLKEQSADPERIKLSGADLTAAQFVLFRRGGVKFLNIDKWIYSDDKLAKDLPVIYDTEYVLTGIDLSNQDVRYTSLTHLNNLSGLTHLSIANVPQANDWWMDYISGTVTALQHLDISGCSNITYRGISILYRLTKLESLNVSNLRYSIFLEMTLLELEGLFPNLRIYGYDSLKREEPSEIVPEPSEAKK